MEFYTQNGLVRPLRTSEKTRQFAYDSLNRRYGLNTLEVMNVQMDDVEGFGEMSKLEQYNAVIKKIVDCAPIRICENELISGAATLGTAIYHTVPATYNGNTMWSSMSHLTADFETVLKRGINGIKADVLESLKKHKGTPNEEFLNSCLFCIEQFDRWRGRYLDALKDKPEYKANYENLLKVPFEPAENFYQAIQSMWFCFAFNRLCGNWPAFGRIDVLLGDYLKNDLASGALTLDEAREIFSHFFIKGCEWIHGKDVGGGDAQHYQNIILAGIDPDGNDVTNEVTYLVLDIIEEFGISDFPTTVRISKNTDEALLKRVAEVMRYGGGILAVYNEDIVIPALVNEGYDLKEARKFANDGCWEVQVPGKTFFMYSPFDVLYMLQKKTLRMYDGTPEFADFDELYDAFLKDLYNEVKYLFDDRETNFKYTSVPGGDWRWNELPPCTLISLFIQGCVENGRSYLECGPVYNVVSPHMGGFADAANSLFAIKKLVFDEKKVSFGEFMDILKNDWEGCEPLRQYTLNKYSYYGNGNSEADALAAKILSDFSDICRSFKGKSEYIFPAGVSTFGRQLGWSSRRLACPHGRKKGEVLAPNCSPTPNSSKEGATSVIKSYCAIDHTKLASGSALDLKLLPSSIAGEEGLDALVTLLRGFVELGGFFMQPDVVDASTLRDAQEHPENYLTLSVRASGWNARFVTLDRNWQNMVIGQMEH